MSINMIISAIITCLLKRLELSKGTEGSLHVFLGLEFSDFCFLFFHETWGDHASREL